MTQIDFNKIDIKKIISGNDQNNIETPFTIDRSKIPDITLDEYQQKAHDEIIDWFKSNPYKEYRLAGYAGTGKSTILFKIVETLLNEYKNNLVVNFCSFTGKASEVLYNKVGFLGECSTIHSLIYRPNIDSKGKIKGWSKIGYQYLQHIDLIIVDEASMVSKEIWKDLNTYNIPILCVGDHGQLGPVSKDMFNLMKEPDFKLEKIHRQAKDNPIIKLSFIARNEGYIERGFYGSGVAKLEWNIDDTAKKTFNQLDFDNSNTQVLCGMNKTRVSINNFVRKRLYNNPKSLKPINGEKLICLKNNKGLNIMNGSMGHITKFQVISDLCYSFEFKKVCTENTLNVIAYKNFFGKEKYEIPLNDMNEDIVKSILNEPLYTNYCSVNAFDFGYCISVHKSQGSEFDKVVVIEERNKYQSDEDYAKWLYTAVTRSSDKLLIISNY